MAATPENTAAQIKIILISKGYTQRDIADQCDVAPSAVSMVVNSRGRSRKIENRIASLTGVPLAELWPAWHGKDAQRRHRPRMSPHQLSAALAALAARAG